jgi:stage II sporulation protein D
MEGLKVKNAANGRVLSAPGRGRSVVIAFSSSGEMTVAGKPTTASVLDVTSTSEGISLDRKDYPGRMRVLRQGNGLLVVNIVDLDTYVKAVVPSEMLPTWPQEALKAQAVVSRSFILFNVLRNQQKDFDITSSTQIYNPEKRDPRTDQAVDATANIVLFYRDELLLPYFSACCGGFTEYAKNVWGGEGVFPPTVECPYCRGAPDYRWQARMPLSELRRKLRFADMNSARSIAIHRRSSSGRRITALKIQGSNGDKIIGINQFRMMLGPNLIRSGFFDMKVEDNTMTFTGRGWGHGVGMCQRGAKVLADRGESFKSVLRHYFPGARTRKLRW